MKRKTVNCHVKPSAASIGGSTNKWHEEVKIVQALKGRKAET
jgi:hypothetical protein